MANQKSYRKFLATGATAAMVATAVVPAASFAAESTPFKDVSSNYSTAVNYLYTNGITSGKTETTFGTYDSLTRGDAAVIIAKALKLDTANAKDAGFKDVNSRVKGAVNALVEKGIISGYSKDEFKPAEALTRGAMAKILANAYGFADYAKATPFKDVSSTFKPFVEALYGAGITGGKTPTTYGTDLKITRGDFANLLYKSIKFEAPVAKVVSVSAINGSQLEVKFNKAVDQTSAETAANYTILRNAASETGFTAELQEDGKTVIITLATPVANTAAASFSITIQNVLLEGSYYDTVEYFATSLTVADTKAPEIASVTSTTNANTASSVTVTFSEPVASPTLKVDGVTKPASLSADGYTATISNLDLSAAGTHTIEAVNLTDLSGNVTESTTKSFTVTKDTNAASYTVSTSSDNVIKLTFNKAMNASTVLAGVTLKGEDLNDLAGGDYTVSEVGTSHKVFKIQVNTNPFTATKTSYKYTIVTKNTIADSLGNLSPATTNSATLSVDTTKPSVQSINYVKDNTGKVTKLLVKYSEAVTPQAGTINILKLADGTTAASVTATGTALADGQTVEYDLAAATALAGEYEVQLPAGIVKDKSFATNASLLSKQTVNFGAASSTTLKVASASVAAGNAVTVNFDKGVTYASATNPANYTINGVALPADTVITYASATQVTFTLPTNFIATTDTGAVLRVANVKTPDGVTVSTNQTVVSVVDNTLPLFSKTAINGDGTISLTFSEAVVSSAGSIGDFTFAVNNKDVTVGNGNVSVADGTGADAGKYVFTFKTSVATTAETVAGHDATATTYFDVNGDGNYQAATDILVQSKTGLDDADLANYTSTTYSASKFSSVVIGSIGTPTVVKDAEGNALKGDQAITVK